MLSTAIFTVLGVLLVSVVQTVAQTTSGGVYNIRCNQTGDIVPCELDYNVTNGGGQAVCLGGYYQNATCTVRCDWLFKLDPTSAEPKCIPKGHPAVISIVAVIGIGILVVAILRGRIVSLFKHYTGTGDKMPQSYSHRSIMRSGADATSLSNELVESGAPGKRILYEHPDKLLKEIVAPKGLSAVRLIKPFVRPHMALLAFALVSKLLFTAANLTIPHFTGGIFDTFTNPKSDLKDILRDLIPLGAAASVQIVFSAVHRYSNAWLTTSLQVSVRKFLIYAFSKQQSPFFDVNPPGSLNSRLSADSDFVSVMVTTILGMTVTLTSYVGLLILIFFTNWKLAAVTFYIIPYLIISAQVYGAANRVVAHKLSSEKARTYSVVYDILTKMVPVTLFNMHKIEVQRLGKMWAKDYNLVFLSRKYLMIYEALNITMTQVTFLFLLTIGGWLIQNDEMTTGDLVAFILYYQQAVGGAEFVANVFGRLEQAIGKGTWFLVFTSEMDVQLMAYEMARPTPQRPKREMYKDTSVEFDNVHFAYPRRPDNQILRGLSFRVEGGTSCVLVGGNGCGKTTALRLLTRLYNVSSGSVRIGGRDINHYNRWQIGYFISYIPQKPPIFARTVAENIAYGTDATMEEIVAASKRSFCHDFIEEFPDGYNTIVRDSSLSGGQKQRLVLARCILHDPLLLLIDEGTSALDPESLAYVQQTLDELTTSRTSITITHNMDVMIQASLIIVLDQGKVAQIGSHSELVKDRTGIYREKFLRSTARLRRVSTQKLIGDASGKGLSKKRSGALPRFLSPT